MKNKDKIIPYLSVFLDEIKCYTAVDIYIECEANKNSKEESDILEKRFSDGTIITIYIIDNFIAEEESTTDDYTITILMNTEGGVEDIITVSEKGLEKLVDKCSEFKLKGKHECIYSVDRSKVFLMCEICGKKMKMD